MSTYLTNDIELTSIANAIRNKNKTTDLLTYPQDFIESINEISGGVDISDATATSNDILEGEIAYSNNGKIIGTIPRKNSQTYTPGKTSQTIEAGQYLAGNQIINGDSNLLAGNIAEGVSIFGVQGSHKAGNNITVKSLTINMNGTTTAPTNEAYSPIVVNVPNSYGASDENKVVKNGVLNLQTSKNITTNGTYDTTLNSNVTVNVPNIYTSSDEGKVVNNSTLVEQSSRIIEANGTYDTTLNNHVSVNVPTETIVSVKSNDVNFLDYDGTIVYSYSKSEFSNLTSMPMNPSHSGLTAQGWNWSLSDAKAYVAKYGRLYIGQMYITDDGKTRIYIHLEKGRTSPMLGVSPNGTVDVDWGDGTAHDTLTGTSTSVEQWTPTHNYAAPGDYIIKLTVDGSMKISSSSNGPKLLSYSSSNDNRNTVYQNAIQKIEIGGGITNIGYTAFEDCYSLRSISIPNNITRIDSYAFEHCSFTSINVPNSIADFGSGIFRYCSNLTFISLPNNITDIELYSVFNECHNLTSISIPSNVTLLDSYLFINCYSLTSVSIPDSVTRIKCAFRGCNSLTSINIPDSVISIETGAFSYCYGISEYHFTRVTPPTLSNSDAFTDIAADCIIYVPVGSLEAYQTATNWSTYADYMQEEPS